MTFTDTYTKIVSSAYTSFYERIHMWCFLKYHIPIHTFVVFVACVSIFYSNVEVDAISVRLPLRESEQPFYVFFTMALTHENSLHLWNNMLILFCLGSVLEFVHGTLSHIAIFWISSATGALTQALLSSTRLALMKGASGGVYGILGAYIAHSIINWNEAPFRGVWIGGLFFVVITNIVSYISSDDAYKENIGHFAHITGGLQGICVGILTLKNLKVRRWERCLEWTSFLSGSILLIWPWIGYAIVSFIENLSV